MSRLGLLALALVFVAIGSACGDDGGDDASGDDGGGPDAPALPSKPDPDARALCDQPFEACGGEVVGNWKVRTVCFDGVAAILPALSEPDCSDSVRTITTRAAGSYRFGDDGSASTNVTIALDLDTSWSDACVQALTGDPTSTATAVCNDLEGEYNTTAGIETAACRVEGMACSCKIASEPSSVHSSGNYVVKGDAIDNGAGEPDPYCVDGDILRISVSEAGLTGVIVLSQ
jgi:hypothetical protein